MRFIFLRVLNINPTTFFIAINESHHNFGCLEIVSVDNKCRIVDFLDESTTYQVKLTQMARFVRPAK
jgi:hypothetical protein